MADTIEEILTKARTKIADGQVFSHSGVLVKNEYDDFLDEDGHFGSLEPFYTSIFESVDEAREFMRDREIVQSDDLEFQSFNLSIGTITVQTVGVITGADIVNDAIDSVGKAGE